MQLVENLNKNKKVEEGRIVSFLLRHLSSSALDMNAPESQALEFRLNYIASFLESPAGEWQTLGFLSNYNCMIQFL